MSEYSEEEFHEEEVEELHNEKKKTSRPSANPPSLNPLTYKPSGKAGNLLPRKHDIYEKEPPKVVDYNAYK